MNKSVLLLLLIVSSVNMRKLTSQKILNLEECIDYAICNNLELKQLENNIKLAERAVINSKLIFLPDIYIQYHHFLSSGSSLNIENYSWENENIQQGDMELTSEFVIFNGFKNIHEVRSKKLSKDLVTLEKEYKIFLLGLDIIKLYFQLILINQNIKTIMISKSFVHNEITKLSEEIHVGKKPKSDIYELNAQVNKEQTEIISLSYQMKDIKLQLMELLNWTEEEELEITEFEYTDYKPIDNNMLSSLNTNEIISGHSIISKMTDLNESLVYSSIQLRRASYYPTVSLRSSLSSRYLKEAINPLSVEQDYSFVSQISNNQNKQIVISVTYPILNKFQKRSDINTSKVELKNKQLESQILKQTCLNDLFKLYENIKSLDLKIETLKEMITNYEKSYMVATEKYRSGLLDLYTCNITKNNYTNSLIEYNKLKVERAMYLELLKFYKRIVLN